MTPDQRSALRRICNIIVEAVRESDPILGAPGGIIYAALMEHGCTMEQYTGLMSGLVNAKILRKSGECYFVR